MKVDTDVNLVKKSAFITEKLIESKPQIGKNSSDDKPVDASGGKENDNDITYVDREAKENKISQRNENEDIEIKKITSSSSSEVVQKDPITQTSTTNNTQDSKQLSACKRVLESEERTYIINLIDSVQVVVENNV